MILGVHAWVLAVLALTFTVGATTQGLVGLGVGMVSAPVTALVAPTLVPELLLWVALTMPMVTLTRDRHAIDWRGLAWAVPARIPGTALGVLLVGWFSAREISVFVGVMVLASVLLTVRTLEVPIRPGTLVGAGLISGATGTASSIGGPPIALLYQHRDPEQVRSTLAVYFLLGATFSLVGLGLSGQLTASTFWLAVLMLPCLVLGFGLSRALHRVVPRHHLRTGVLLVCGLSSVTLLVRSLLG
ncbi:MAG TPA: sulfite exporter TauE/SafE family protein [Nocardioidaceae bacterium]|jgi:uncharacterized membrane protein YfcA